ncbi:MAG TPA: hypothetical protein PLN89_09940, partial [Elusimicrobiota bacterium]|nr:hypothetical protein [Elusimicrobiota bacterium]
MERVPDGPLRFRQEARRSFREILWRPLVEIPRLMDVLEHRAAFLEFLRTHPVRVSERDASVLAETAERLFRQRHAGLTQWIPAGTTLGLGFGVGVLLTVLALGGTSLLTHGVAGFVAQLFFLTLVSIVTGGVAGLYAGHVLYNLFHPRARLALEPPSEPSASAEKPAPLGGFQIPRLRTVSVENGWIPHLRAEFDGGRETVVHLYGDTRGPGTLGERIVQFLSNAFWRPWVEMPWVVRALFRPAAFLDFLRLHSIVLRGSMEWPDPSDTATDAAMAAAVREAVGDGFGGVWAPRVGAVILDGDGRPVARGHNRGEGPHHAEQAALLRWMASRAPPGSVDRDLLRLSIWP